MVSCVICPIFSSSVMRCRSRIDWLLRSAGAGGQHRQRHENDPGHYQPGFCVKAGSRLICACGIG